jgi:hypothetical protein
MAWPLDERMASARRFIWKRYFSVGIHARRKFGGIDRLWSELKHGMNICTLNRPD